MSFIRPRIKCTCIFMVCEVVVLSWERLHVFFKWRAVWQRGEAGRMNWLVVLKQKSKSTNWSMFLNLVLLDFTSPPYWTNSDLTTALWTLHYPMVQHLNRRALTRSKRHLHPDRLKTVLRCLTLVFSMFVCLFFFKWYFYQTEKCFGVESQTEQTNS